MTAQPKTSATILADDERLQHVAHVVSAFVYNNHLTKEELINVISSVNGVFAKIDGVLEGKAATELIPAVPVKKSITSEYIICLEDGKKFKSLKRHLKTTYNLTPDEYRSKWNLPIDYPMVSPSYSEARSALAKAAGLGRAAALARSKKVAGASSVSSTKSRPKAASLAVKSSARSGSKKKV